MSCAFFTRVGERPKVGGEGVGAYITASGISVHVTRFHVRWQGRGSSAQIPSVQQS